jgi:hypothetical protein
MSGDGSSTGNRNWGACITSGWEEGVLETFVCTSAVDEAVEPTHCEVW